MTEFDDIKDIAGWTAKLGELLKAAKTAAQEEDLPPRLEINERLMQFVENSWPNTGEIKALDDIATGTASALMRKTVEERLEAITDRTGAYQRINKQLAGVADTGEAAAGSIRLEAVTNFLDSAAKAVEAAKELQNAIKGGSVDPNLADKIQKTIALVEDLRASLASAG